LTPIRLTALFILLAGPPSRRRFAAICRALLRTRAAPHLPTQWCVEDPATGLTRSTVTGGTGDYLVAEPPVGAYTLTITMPGFEAKKIENIEIAVAKTTNINVPLGVATQQSVVEVTATAATLETSSSSLVANVDDKSVQVPMNGRDFIQMVKLAPGTLFWTTADLEAKLREFQKYFNEHRTHAGLEGRLPRFWRTWVADEFRLVSLAEALSRVVPNTDRRVVS
jgi:hypothetical protein